MPRWVLVVLRAEGSSPGGHNVMAFVCIFATVNVTFKMFTSAVQ